MEKSSGGESKLASKKAPSTRRRYSKHTSRPDYYFFEGKYE
jgi:hypothetical protein